MLMLSLVKRLLSKYCTGIQISITFRQLIPCLSSVKYFALKDCDNRLPKRQTIITGFFSFVILFLISNTAKCQNDTIQLKEFEVHGIRPEISASSASPVQQLTLKKIDALPSLSVAEAIRNFSGVVLKDFGGVGGIKTVLIRSMGANHTAVFIDGQPTSDAATGQTDLGKISLQDVSNIQLSIGQPEFDLQPARMFASASILEISSTEPTFLKKNNVITVSAKAGSFGTFAPSVGIDSKITRNITTSLKTNYYTANGQFPYKVNNGAIVSDLIRKNSDIQTADAVFRTKINFNDSSSLKFKATYFHSERGLPGAVILYNNFSNQRLLNRDMIYGIEYLTPLSKRFKMKLSANFTDLKLIYTDPSYHNESGVLENRYQQQEYYISDAVTYKVSELLKLSLASDLILNALNTNAYSVHQPERLTSLTAGRAVVTMKKTEINGSILMTIANDLKINSENSIHYKLSPALSVIQTLTRDRSFKARFMYKNTFRMPTFNDLYYTLAGNNNLKPETANLYDLGLIFNKAYNNTTGLNFRIDGFINQVRNKIVTVPTQNLFIWRTQNIGKADIKGFELYADLIRQINNNWSIDLSGNYTYQEAKDITDKTSSNYKHQLAYIPYETAGGLLTAYYKNYGLGVNTLYNGFRFSTIDNNADGVLKSWTTTDLTFSYQRMIYKMDCKLKIEAANVFNRQYEIIRGFPMVGRSCYIKLIVTI